MSRVIHHLLETPIPLKPEHGRSDDVLSNVAVVERRLEYHQGYLEAMSNPPALAGTALHYLSQLYYRRDVLLQQR